MSILRIKNNKEQNDDCLFEGTSLELFELDIDNEEQKKRKMNPKSAIKSKFKSVVKITSLFVFIIVSAFSIVKIIEYSRSPNLSYTYFEIKLIDHNGHPISGAVVTKLGKEIGMTDSFGEWRRFLKVKVDSNLSLKFTKSIVTANKTKKFVKTKNIKITAQKDLEIKSTLQMSLKTSTKLNKSTKQLNKNFAQGFSKKYNNEKAQSVLATPMNTRVRDISFSLGRESLNNLRDEFIFSKLIPALSKRAVELGMSTSKSAKIKVNLVHLTTNLMLVEGLKNKKVIFSFLKNYNNNEKLFAREILYMITMHANTPYVLQKGTDGYYIDKPLTKLWLLRKSYRLISQNKVLFKVARVKNNRYYLTKMSNKLACLKKKKCILTKAPINNYPKIASQRLQRLKFVGDSYNLRFYVSGMKATLKPNNIVEYWGNNNSLVNLTILRDTKLVLRKKIKSRQVPIKVIALKKENISKL